MAITDEQIQQLLPTTRPYCVFTFQTGPGFDHPDADRIQWEHLRHLFQARAEGRLAIVAPVVHEADLVGFGICNTPDVEEVKSWLDQDPNVQAGRLTYRVYQVMSFPGDGLGDSV
jgi:uncharacterized protein YciI